MLSAWLMGAGVTGLLDAWLSPELAGTPLRREVLAVVLVGDLGLAAAAAGVLHALRIRIGALSAALAGAALAAAPGLGVLADSAPLGLAAALALGLAAVRVARGRSLPVFATRAAAAALVGVVALAALATPSLVPSLPESSDVADGRPDLILISIDTLRADALDAECAPNLARLAGRGVSAEFALAPSSLTLPSHVTMLSGLPIDAHGVFDNHAAVPELDWLGSRLRRSGYRTAAVVSNYLVRAEAGFGSGIEVFDEAPVAHAGPVERFRERVRRATWWGLAFGGLPAALDPLLFGDAAPDSDRDNGRRTTDHALHLLRQLQEQPAPYFLFVHYMDPHDPYAPPQTSSCGGDPGGMRSADWRALRRIGADLERGAPAAAIRRDAARVLYDREVQYVDHLLAELLGRVDAGGRPTWILLTADHGEHFGDHHLMTHGDSVYEAGLRVPFLLVGPGLEPGRLAHPPQLADVAPTLLAAAGLAHADLPGVDLTRGPPAPRAHLARAGRHVALRDAEGFKLVVELGRRAAPGRLYAPERDPGETDDLSRVDPERFARLERELRARAARRAAPRDARDEHRAALEALGYLE